MRRLAVLLCLCAASLWAQKSILGTLADFHSRTLEFELRADGGATLRFKVSPQTQVMRIPPGERDLSKAAPGAVTDLAIGDRLLVTFVDGMAEPRRIVLMSPTDIERRNQAERLDWQRRGIAGIVTGRTADSIALEMRTMQAAQTIQIDVSPKTNIRRYAPDSVKFSDARPSTVAEISAGDQLRVRGNKSEDGARLAAEDIVFGTFRTVLGPIVSVNREAGEIQIRDLTSKALLTVKVTADSRLKRAPSPHEMFAQMMNTRETPAAPAEQPTMAQMLDRLPPGAFDDLKPGSSVAVTATRGARPDSLTAIMLVANMDGIIQMAQAQAGDPAVNPVEAISRMHHGMLDGPGGLSLPALIP